MMSALFSIITVTYNAEATISRTLESVAEQDCTLYEHIIVDGLSTDHTLSLVKTAANSHTRIISQKDSGIYDAMNTGLQESRGEYLIFLNAGDRFHSPSTLSLLADAIKSNNSPGIVYGQTDLVDIEGRRLGSRHLRAPERLDVKSLKEGMVVCHQAMAVLRQIAPSYNLAYRYSADYEWLLKCVQKSDSNVYVPAVVCDYLSEGMTTAHHKESLKERFKIMCEYFGFWSTTIQHLKFIPRYLRRRSSAVNVQ